MFSDAKKNSASKKQTNKQKPTFKQKNKVEGFTLH